MENIITGYTKTLGIIANPIKHSLSPIMHNAACQKLGLDYVYLAFEVPKEKFDEAIKGLKALQVAGFNVSMPYKQAIIPHLDSLSLRAQLCGAVNTVLYKNGKYIGDITDGAGFMEGLYDHGWDPIGKKMVILGAGGAALAIMIQAAMDGVSEIVVYKRNNSSYEDMKDRMADINRKLGSTMSLRPLEDTDALKQDLKDSYLLVNATNVGMGDLEGQSCIPDTTYLPKGLKVVDIIYNPKETKLLRQAKEAGLEYMNGKPMILFQGAHAFTLWTKEKMPISYIKEILEMK